MYQTIDQTLRYTTEGFELNQIIEYLGRHYAEDVKKAVLLIRKIINTTKTFYITADTRDTIKEILSAALDSGDDAREIIIEIVNTFGKRGEYEWRFLLDELGEK